MFVSAACTNLKYPNVPDVCAVRVMSTVLAYDIPGPMVNPKNAGVLVVVRFKMSFCVGCVHAGADATPSTPTCIRYLVSVEVLPSNVDNVLTSDAYNISPIAYVVIPVPPNVDPTKPELRTPEAFVVTTPATVNVDNVTAPATLSPFAM